MALFGGGLPIAAWFSALSPPMCLVVLLMLSLSKLNKFCYLPQKTIKCQYLTTFIIFGHFSGILIHLPTISCNFGLRLHETGCWKPTPVENYGENNLWYNLGVLPKFLSTTFLSTP